MIKKKIPVISIVLYVLAGLLAIYTVWVVINSANTISSAIAAGQLTVSGSEFQIVNFYMSNCAQYALFAIVLFVLGWMLQKNSSRTEIGPEPWNEATVTVKAPDNAIVDDYLEDPVKNEDK